MFTFVNEFPPDALFVPRETCSVPGETLRIVMTPSWGPEEVEYPPALADRNLSLRATATFP